MDRPLYEVILCPVLTALMLCIGIMLPTCLWKARRASDSAAPQGRFPAPIAAYVVTTALAGALTDVLFLILVKRDPVGQMLQFGSLQLCVFLAFYIGQSGDSDRPTQQKQAIWTAIVPFSIAMLVGALVLSFV